MADARPNGLRLIVLESTPSTNDVAWERGRALSYTAQKDAPSVRLAVLAREQTEGRGRAGRTWASPRGSGLYLSFYLRPDLPPARAALLTLAAGLAVREACRAHGATPALKWPNDLLAPDGSGRKLCGILTETKSEGGVVREAVIGNGLNLRAPAEGWPDDLKPRVVTLEEVATQVPAAEEFALAILEALDRELSRLAEADGARALVRDARAACTLWGRRVEVEDGHSKVHGIAKDWADDGGLVVRLDGGSDLVVHAGDVTVRWDAP